MAIATPRVIPVPNRIGRIDAAALLRRPPLRAPDRSQLDRALAGGTLTRLDAGQRVQLAALTSPEPRLMVVQAALSQLPAVFTNSIYFELQWSLGGDLEGPAIRFFQSEPIALLARAATLSAYNYTGINTASSIFASISFAEQSPTRQARPLWVDMARNVLSIAFGASASFNLSPFTRRIRVARAAAATPFTVDDLLTGTVQSVAANGEFPWREVVGRSVQVTNNAGAGSDIFAVHEELGL